MSSYQLARACGLAQPAWYIMQRIRKAMRGKENTLLQGIIEMDETYCRWQATSKIILERLNMKRTLSIKGVGKVKRLLF